MTTTVATAATTSMFGFTPGVLVVSCGCLAAGSWLWWHREAPKATTALFLGAGAAIGGVIAEAILSSPTVLVGTGLVGLIGLSAGGWLWWQHGGRISDSPASLVSLAVGSLALCLVAARLLALAPTNHWSTAARLTLVTGVLVLAAEVVVKGMWKGKARPRRYHPFLALALPTVAIAVGVPALAPVLTGLSGGLADLGANLTTPSVAHAVAHHSQIGATR